MKRIKKITSLFLIGISIFAVTKNTNARLISINEIAEEFNKSSMVQLFNKLGSKVNSQINSGDKTLDVYSNGNKIFSVTYSDDYIEYDNRNATINEDNYGKETTNLSWIYSLATSVLKLSGHEDKSILDLKNSIQKSDNYNIDGASVEIGDYNVNGKSGKYIKYFKVPLETEKIDAILNNLPLTNQNPQEEDNLKELVPTIVVKNITDSSITLNATVSTTLRTIVNQNIMCYIYRSTSENGDFEKISNEAIDCSNPTEIVDNNLASNTTYYYKAIIDGGENYSKTIAVTTFDNKVNTVIDNQNDDEQNNNVNDNTTLENKQKNDEITENPDTGATLPIIIISILLIGSFLIIKYSNKKNAFNKL